ncbi:copper resistance protein NlpE [Chitinophaga solisilvae]|uniref:copper resistance protein NlpE n=1 Tax=Chitinophaga solisilvae TaxID=1233460 RepID=UPI0013711276|nr:copper resistance protein NlpE [Chitinophaga solisilvae]
MKYPAIFVLALALAGSAACKQGGSATGGGNHADSAQADKWTVYSGTLPCADCSGIATELKLHEQANDPDYAFTLRETYQGVSNGKDQTFNSEGSYKIIHGNGGDKDAVIILLNPDKDRNLQRYFQKVSDTELKQLDKDMRQVQSTLNYSLKSNQ